MHAEAGEGGSGGKTDAGCGAGDDGDGTGDEDWMRHAGLRRQVLGGCGKLS